MSIRKLREKARRLLTERPDMGRCDLAKELETTDYKARKLLAELKNEPIGPKIAYFDIETTGFKPDIHRIICAIILSYPSMTYHVFRQDKIDKKRDFTDDAELCRQIRDCLEDHHIIVGWWSKGFDVPFINTRLVQNGDKKLRNHLHIDPYYYHKGWHGVKPGRASLEAVGDFYGVSERKYKVDKETWTQVSIGDPNAMEIIVDRCKSDVLLLAQVTQQVFEADLVKNITRYA